MQKKGGTAYYIGANTGTGFVNDTAELTAGLKRLYIIKGGPGTGKSTLMKKFAAAAEESGHETELFYCSSDSDSLDGTAVRGIGVGIIDGTAPHSADPKYPGAYDSIIDLGAFWDTEKLSKRYDEIRCHSERKASLYKTVYRYLSVISAIRTERTSLVLTCTDTDKCGKAAERIIKKLGEGGGTVVRSRRVTAVGMKGSTYLDTFERLAENSIYINDRRGLAGYCMHRILTNAERYGFEVMVSHDHTGETDAIYLPERGFAVISGHIGGRDAKELNTERFILKDRIAEKKSRIKMLEKTENELMSRVRELFVRIAEEHFTLEGIYRSAMNFSGVEEVTGRIITEYFG